MEILNGPLNTLLNKGHKEQLTDFCDDLAYHLDLGILIKDFFIIALLKQYWRSWAVVEVTTPSVLVSFLYFAIAS